MNRHQKILWTLGLALFAGAAVMHAQTWPLDPTGSDHPIGNSFGEYQNFGAGTIFQHGGIDILATPKLNSDGTENPAAPWVRATVAGTPTQMDNDPGDYNFAYVTTAGGRDYLYGHLEEGSYDASFVTAFNNGTAIAANDLVAKVTRWDACDYHHLHYEIQDGATIISPYFDISPDPDSFAPQIESINFAVNNSNPWSVLNPVAPGGCTVVSGLVDVVAQINDRDAAGSALAGAATNWVRNLRWRACPEATPDCAWIDTHLYDDMPFTWWSDWSGATADVIFSGRAPWFSSSDYCAASGWEYGVVTNFGAGGTADASGAWNTTALANGSYSVSVEATDFSGNVTRRSVPACVQNGGGCTTEVMIRDAADDLGGIPYGGPVWWVSPDITANPGTAFEDINIRLGIANPIDVAVRNSGSCVIPAGTTYDVCLGWGLPSGSVAHPLPPAQVIGCQTVTVPAGGWAVGAPVTTTITWTPDAMTVPLGHHCLVAWVNAAADPVVNTPAVNWDDNRAQQNIEFVTGAPGAPGQAGTFWVNPQEMIRDRSIELRLRDFGENDRVTIFIPPGLDVKSVKGAALLPAIREKPSDPLWKHPLCDDRCVSAEDARQKGCTLVLQGIDVRGRVVLEIGRVDSPQRVLVEHIGDGGEIDVVEHGLLRQVRERTPVGGLTIKFVREERR